MELNFKELEKISSESEIDLNLIESDCSVDLSVHFPPVFKKNLFPKGFPVADALLLPETNNST